MDAERYHRPASPVNRGKCRECLPARHPVPVLHSPGKTEPPLSTHPELSIFPILQTGVIWYTVEKSLLFFPLSASMDRGRYSEVTIVNYALPIPTIRYKSGLPTDERLPLVILGVEKGTDPGSLPTFAKGAGELLAKGDFRGDKLEIALFYPREGGPERLMLIGLGGGKETDRLTLIRHAAVKAAREARKIRVTRYSIALPHAEGAAESEVLACAQGSVIGARFSWREPDAPPIEEITIHGNGNTESGEHSCEVGVGMAEATLFARALIMKPANMLTPQALVEAATAVANEEKITINVFDEKRLEEEGLHAICAVGRGSDNPPRLACLEYDGSNGKGPIIALVGKGITFDSGGLSLKPPDRMVHMKYDMSGAATVLSAIRGAARLKLPVRVVAVIPTAENMPGPGSYRPGDVVSSYKGLTIEVNNTDAEGRLILADALAWTEKNIRPDEIIDIATLTGACRIALGGHAAGLFSTDDGIAEHLTGAADESGERIWLFPLWEVYKKEIKSDVADMKNVAEGQAGGGAIVAAVFLSRFIERTKWAHIDIAGVSWAGGNHGSGPKGSTGFGAALLLSYLRKRSRS